MTDQWNMVLCIASVLSVMRLLKFVVDSNHSLLRHEAAQNLKKYERQDLQNNRELQNRQQENITAVYTHTHKKKQKSVNSAQVIRL